MTAEYGAIVGQAVRSRREDLELTQRDLVDRLAELGWHLDVTAITRIEKGERDLRISQLHKLADALEMTPDVFVLGGVERELRGYLRELFRAGDEFATAAVQYWVARRVVSSWIDVPDQSPGESLKRLRDNLRAALSSDALVMQLSVASGRDGVRFHNADYRAHLEGDQALRLQLTMESFAAMTVRAFDEGPSEDEMQEARTLLAGLARARAKRAEEYPDGEHQEAP